MPVDFATNESYQYRYTDRDVRSDSRLRELAEEYVRQYDGEFEPLLEAREYLESASDLTVPLARRVLNCMRHDIRVTLPVPERPLRLVKSGDKKVTPCERIDPHEPHGWDSEKNRRLCNGIPWPINRFARRGFDTRVKYPFIISRTGSLVHKTAGHGQMWWVPVIHGWGFTHIELCVKLVCKNPSWITNGRLLKVEPNYVELAFADKVIVRCKFCFANELEGEK